MDSSVIVDEQIDPAELLRLAKAYETQIARGEPSALTTFAYAHALIKSNNQDVRKGIRLLEELLRKDTEDIPKRDYVFYLAIAHTRLKEYDRALAYVDVLLGAESGNRQALDLKELIKNRMHREGILGMAIIGGGIAVLGGLAVAALLSKR